MSYIWEQKNRGISLYEKALIEARTMLEASDTKLNFRGNIAGLEKTGSVNLDHLKDVLTKAVTDAGGVPDENFTFEADGIKITPKTDELRLAITKAIKDDAMFTKAIAPDEGKPADSPEKLSENIGKMLMNIKDEKLRDALEQAIGNIYAGKMPNGAEPTPEQEATIARWKKIIERGSPEERNGIIVTLGNAISSGRIKLKGDGMYSVQDEKKSASVAIQMPAMFDAEPDDSMWNEMIVNDFGFPIINLGHPAVAKIIKSENPEEECPGDLKQFKKAVYGDKRLTAVFGEGGISRVVLGKMANLLTLGIAGATVDAGKRADRIIKELHEKGGRIAHRNLLVVDYDDIVDADPDNSELKIEAAVYSRAKKKAIGVLEVPVSALAQFYSAVDPLKSASIYIEVAASNDKIGKSLDECSAISGEALMEGPASWIAGKARAVQDFFTGEKATSPEKTDGGKIAELKEKWVECLNRNGHPPFYVLKPKSANKEVDVISNSATGQAGTSGGKVNMVTMKVGDHKGAIFMTPKDIELYFSAT